MFINKSKLTTLFLKAVNNIIIIFLEIVQCILFENIESQKLKEMKEFTASKFLINTLIGRINLTTHFPFLILIVNYITFFLQKNHDQMIYYL